MRLRSFRMLAAAIVVAFTCTSTAMADFMSFGSPLTFSCGSNTVANNDGMWFGSTLTCTGLSTKVKTTVTFSGALLTYTCNGSPCIAFVPGGSITFDPKCSSPVTTYTGGQWHTTAPCKNGASQFISGCACPLPSNAHGTITNCQWYTTSCQCSANGCSATWSGQTSCHSNWQPSNGNCSPHSDGSCTCSAPEKWHCPCNGGSHGTGGGGTSPGES